MAQTCKILWLTETWNGLEKKYSSKDPGSTGYYWRCCYNSIRARELGLFQLVPIQLQGHAPECNVFSLSPSRSNLYCSCVKFGDELSCMQRGWLGYEKGVENSGAKQGFMKLAACKHRVRLWSSFCEVCNSSSCSKAVFSLISWSMRNSYHYGLHLHWAQWCKINQKYLGGKRCLKASSPILLKRRLWSTVLLLQLVLSPCSHSGLPSRCSGHTRPVPVVGLRPSCSPAAGTAAPSLFSC